MSDKNRWQPQGCTKAIADFIVDNAGIIFFYILILAISPFFMVNEMGEVRPLFSALPHIFSNAFFPASLFACIRFLFLLSSKRFKFFRFLAGGVTFFVILISFADIWMRLNINSRWSDRILRLIFETNDSEASEFLSDNLFTSGSLITFVLFFAVTALAYRFFVKSKVFIDIFKGLTRNATGTISLLLLFMLWNIWSVRVTSVEDCLEVMDSSSQLYSSVKAFKDQFKRVSIMEDAITKSDGRLNSTSDHPARIVWVIGESESKFHSQLYGYGKPTTPEMLKEVEKGNIIIYNDVISCVPNTANMMEILFSPADPLAPEEERFSTPLFPMILRKAGYNVRLFDNQQTLTIKGDKWYELGNCSFINSRKLSEASFSYRNDSIFAYDNDFITYILPKFQKKNYPVVDIIHLMGQHASAFKRVPDEERYKYFKSSDYSDRKDLNEEERQIVADYDNATRFVDSQLARLIKAVEDEDAILVYISDHGELMCDVDSRHWRASRPATEISTAPYMYCVPFVTYTTPKFREKHPALYKRLQQGKDLPFSLAYFSHFMFDLAGVKSRFFNTSLSPLSPSWSYPSRPAVDIGDYDKWMNQK
ncbi:MAG: phosphoethanolamine transferase [Bacteroides sp.]|nr:phosphoethanolamine transferase [Bacteroides sp.]